MDMKKKSVRQNQFHLTENPTTAMKEFLNGSFKPYRKCTPVLSLLVENDIGLLYSRKILQDLHGFYQETREKLSKAKSENKTQTDDSDAIMQLKKELKGKNEQLMNASLGLDHFF